MFTLLTDLDCFGPCAMGRKDILIAGDKIEKITAPGELREFEKHARVLPCSGLLGFPGIVDQHLHLIGGGGENGFASRIGEIEPEEILLAGVSTVVGVLGFDSYTKSLQSLLAKASALESQGITAFIYTGSYAIPTVTVTGSVAKDIILIDKIIGTGEIAISDYRSSQPTFNEFAQLSAQSHIAGLISGKAGIVHIHVGDGKEKLEPLIKLLDKTDLPKDVFVPTHMNRNPQLFEEAISFCGAGGNIDLTAGEKKGIPVPAAIKTLLDKKIELSRVTVSSDANGSAGEDICRIQSLYDDIKNAILQENIPPDQAFSLVTENAARRLRLHPLKGVLREGSDADILITDGAYNLQKLLCRGRLMVDGSKITEGVL